MRPTLLYSITDFRSLDFVVDRLFMKLFKTANIQIVRECQKNLVLSYPVLSWIRDAVNLIVSITLV